MNWGPWNLRACACVAAACLSMACAGPSAEQGASSGALAEGEGARAPAEGEGTQRADVEAPTTEVAPAALPTHALLGIHALPAQQAEDGLGATVQSAAPVAIDLDAHAFPPRALDPVLTIGQRAFHHYSHPAAGVLRFVIADASLLVAGETLRVHHRTDGSDAEDVAVIGEAELAAARQP